MKPSSTPAAPRALPLALTLGEPAGVGGELALKAWLRRDERVPAFFVIDDPGRLKQLSAKIGLDVPLHPIDAPEEAAAVYPGALPVLAQALAAAATPGRPDPANAGAVLCMYHDQALIPLKTIDFDHGVNITLGLPFIRTSPDHGTALDIAGTGRARADSLVAALTIARQMAERRHAAEAQAGFA